MSKDQNQLEKEMAMLEKNDETIEALISHFTPIYSGRIQRREIFESLFLLLSEKYNLERPGDIWDIEIVYADALKLFETFDFSTVINTIEVSDDFFPEGILMEFKAKIKSKGSIWLIHKYDTDPFPSNPHAHQVDSNIKLDLSNGNCYQVRKYIHTIKKKDLLIIREAAAKVFKGKLPPLTI